MLLIHATVRLKIPEGDREQISEAYHTHGMSFVTARAKKHNSQSNVSKYKKGSAGEARMDFLRSAGTLDYWQFGN
jgi:hypothetical protein